MMDISSLREREGGGVFSVSSLNLYIKSLFEGNRTLSAVTVKGEISNFINHRSGHLYFSLKDSEGQLRAVMFRSSAAKLAFTPENGMKVIAFGSVSVFTRDGSYQLYVTSLQPDGQGALSLAFEQLKRKLSEEGLFDDGHKLPIPRYPKRIGVITAPGGAAVRDIINITGRRYPLADVYIYPTLVQGDAAEGDMIKALDWFEESRLADVIIIGRGGGSIEDLWAFNGEKLARRIYSMTVPVISAVGHETDYTICDFVADLRAPTPSGAAEISVPDVKELLLRLDDTFERMRNALDKRLCVDIERFKRLSDGLKKESFLRLLDGYSDGVKVRYDDAFAAINGCLNDRTSALSAICGKLDALNPLSVMKRGYSIALRKNRTVRSVNELSTGDTVNIVLADGSACATVDSVTKD